MIGLDILGLVATCFTTYSFVPQVLRTWKTRDVSGISLSAYAILTVGLGLWIAYGLMRQDLPLIVANCVMVVLVGAITAMKWKWGASPKATDSSSVSAGARS
jgi:MtN3 and saliva related transmembrane protein